MTEDDLFVSAAVRSSVQEGMLRGYDIILELLVELSQCWTSILKTSPPLRLASPAMLEFDSLQLEAVLVTLLATEEESVRWNVVKSLKALRALEEAMPPPPAPVVVKPIITKPVVEKTAIAVNVSEHPVVDIDLNKENAENENESSVVMLESKEDIEEAEEKEAEADSAAEETLEEPQQPEVEPALEPSHALPRVHFLSVLESCSCLSHGDSAGWNGETVLSSLECTAFSKTIEHDESTTAPVHLVPACALRGEAWTIFLAHILRNVRSQELASRVNAMCEENLNELEAKCETVKATQAYWKKKSTWSSLLSSRKCVEVIPEFVLSESEHCVWRNQLVLAMGSFAAMEYDGKAQEYIHRRFLSLISNCHPSVRRSASITIGQCSVSSWLGGPLLSSLSILQSQIRDGAVPVKYTSSTTSSTSNSIETLSPHQLDILRIHLSHIFKLLAWHMTPEQLTLAPTPAGSTNESQNGRTLLIRSSFVSYLLSSHSHLVRGHAHNEFRWDFIEWRANMARIAQRLCTITANSGGEGDQVRTPLLGDAQRRLIFEMFLSWCGYGASSTVYLEKLKLHTAEILAKVSESASAAGSQDTLEGDEKALHQQLNASIEQLQFLSLQAMSALLRGKCFDPNLQSQLQSSVSNGEAWSTPISQPPRSHSMSADVSMHGHIPTGLTGHSHHMSIGQVPVDISVSKGFVFPWLNSLLLSSSPIDRDVAYEALEHFILHNEHLLPSFVTHCYLVQAGSSVISKRYFLVIGNILWRQAEAHRQAEAKASGSDIPPPRLLKLPVSVLLHLIIFKLADLSFSVRSMALRLIPVLEHFYAAKTAQPSPKAEHTGASALGPSTSKHLPSRIFANSFSTNANGAAPPMRVIIGSHLPDTFLSMQLQLSSHFAELFGPKEAPAMFNECARRIMFLHRLRLGMGGGGAGGPVIAAGNSTRINHILEEHISNMIAYLAPWLAHIHLQPESILSAMASQHSIPVGTSPLGASPLPSPGRGHRSLRTFSVLTAKKGPAEIMQQLVEFTFLFSTSASANATTQGQTGTAPYSVASHLLQDLFTQLIRGQQAQQLQPGDAEDAGGWAGMMTDDDSADAPNPNLEIFVTFLFDSLSSAQKSNKLTADWLVCYQRIALYLSRIAPDQTLKLLIGHILHASTSSSPIHHTTIKPTSPASRAMLSKSNFALMLLVEVAYELDLSGEESMHVVVKKRKSCRCKTGSSHPREKGFQLPLRHTYTGSSCEGQRQT